VQAKKRLKFPKYSIGTPLTGMAMRPFGTASAGTLSAAFYCMPSSVPSTLMIDLIYLFAEEINNHLANKILS
jgi:hypothetical protein